MAIYLIGLVFLLASCTEIPPKAPLARYTPVRILQSPIELMQFPRDIKAEYIDPPLATRQIFKWDRYGGEWKLIPVQSTEIKAGYFFKKQVKIAEKVQQQALNFRFIPINAEKGASITLLNEDGEALINIPITEYRISTWNDWGRYTIPISHFLTENAETTVTQAVFKGVQLIIKRRDHKKEPIAIRDLQIGPLFWGVPR